MRTRSKCGATLAALGLAVGAAQAVPTVSVTPPLGARFLPDQKFDLRVEARPTTGNTLTGATLSVDGTPVTFSSTDSSGGFFGYNRRGFSILTPGMHTVTATATDATGTASASAQVEIIAAAGPRRPSRNVIILLGDGMGIQHRTAARIVRYGLTNGRPNGMLAMDAMPALGSVSTSSLNSLVTDSSPGMASYVTGNKSNNNQEGVFPATVASPFAQPRMEYMSEYLHRKFGKSLGIVSTADVEDATPAANAVHTGNRNAGQGICDQYLDESANSGLTVLLGGGRRWFLPSGQFGSSRSTSNDYAALPADLIAAWNAAPGVVDPARNLLADFQTAGFVYASDRTELLAAAPGATKLLGLFGYGNMNVAYDKIAKQRNPGVSGVVDDYFAPNQPMLDEMTTAALTVLNKNQNGFVLMVEGAHIDKQSHAMDADRAIWETIEFDNAVRKCVEFADQVGDTTVIVTADHECAGFSILGGLASTTTIAQLRALPSDKTNTAPGGTAPLRQGVVSGTGFPNYTILADGFPATADVNGKILIGFGANADRYEDWLAKPLPIIDSLLSADIQTSLAGKSYPVNPIDRKPESDNGFFVRGQLSGTQAAHTASDIPISAYSTGNRAFSLFVGVQDNTDVFFKLMRAALGGY